MILVVVLLFKDPFFLSGSGLPKSPGSSGSGFGSATLPKTSVYILNTLLLLGCEEPEQDQEDEETRPRQTRYSRKSIKI